MFRNRLVRSTSVLIGFVMVAGGLSACTDYSEDAAQVTAQAYVSLIATGTVDELDALAELTLTSEPDAIATAAQALAGATERIDIISFSDMHEAKSGSVIVPIPGDVDHAEFVAMTVKYRLAGETYESEVVLAPYDEGDRDDPDAWVVVVPFTGTLVTSPEATHFSGWNLDRFVAGVSVESESPNSVYRAPIYPGVYELDRRLDPYVTSVSETLTIAVGNETDEPVVEILGTDELEPVLVDDLVRILETCPGRHCPDPVSPLVHVHGVDSISFGDWDLEVIEEPDLAIEGDDLSFSGGELRLQLPDGTTTEISVEGSGAWRITQDPEPVVALLQIVESADPD